jgi:hypothetical protein
MHSRPLDVQITTFWPPNEYDVTLLHGKKYESSRIWLNFLLNIIDIIYSNILTAEEIAKKNNYKVETFR